MRLVKQPHLMIPVIPLRSTSCIRYTISEASPKHGHPFHFPTPPWQKRQIWYANKRQNKHIDSIAQKQELYGTKTVPLKTRRQLQAHASREREQKTEEKCLKQNTHTMRIPLFLKISTIFKVINNCNRESLTIFQGSIPNDTPPVSSLTISWLHLTTPSS